jgi:hypothetical protein
VASRTVGHSETLVCELVESFSIEQAREIVAAAVERHEDVERAVRQVAAHAGGDLGVLRARLIAVCAPGGFSGTGRAPSRRAARPIVAELEVAVRTAPARELVELLQRAVSHVLKVIGQRADDSSGLIGALARELLALHARRAMPGWPTRSSWPGG